MSFSENLKTLRKNYPRRLSQEELANALDVTQRVYSYWETGKNEPGIDEIRKLCLFFGVSADYLLGLPKGMPYPDRD